MKIIILFLSFVLFSIVATSQNNCNTNCNWTNELNISTGVDGSGNLISILPALDPYWKLINVAPPSVNGSNGVHIPNAWNIVTPSTYPAWNHYSGANTLSAINTYSFNTNNSEEEQPWVFRRNFCVCDNSAFKFDFDFSADDGGRVVLKNNLGTVIQELINLPPNIGSDHSNFNQPHNGSINSINLSLGNYFVEIELINKSGSYMGFAFRCLITDLTNNKTLTNPSADCCANGLISIKKVLDNDCNVQFNDGDNYGENWAFSLFNSNGLMISTQTTNQWGEATFSGLPAGNYTITEQVQSGWICTNNNQSAVIENGDGVLLTFYNCPDIITSEFCCQIPNFNATLSGNNLNNLTLNLNSGTTQIQEVEISMVDYHATYSEPGCQPINMDAANGHIGYMNTTTNNLSSLNLVAAQNNSHVLDWGPGSPILLNHAVNLSVNPPSVINVSCCSVDFSFCIKVRVKDVNCNVCEQILCYPSDLKCDCGKWNSNYMYLGLNPQTPLSSRPFPVACGGSVTYDGPHSLHIGVSNFSCIPASCQATYKWEVSGPISGNGIGKPFDFNFSQTGTYFVTVTPYCGNQRCEPCKITVIIKPTICDCKGRGWIKDKPVTINSNGQTIGSVFCGSSLSIDYPGNYQVTAPPYLCNPANINPTYTWNIYYNGTLSNSGSGNIFSYNFSQQGNYTIEFIPNCCGNICPPCKFEIRIKDSIQCDCKGRGWIKDKPATINSNGQTIGSVFCGSSLSIDYPGNYQVTAPPYICNPANINPTYTWHIYYNGTLSNSGSGNIFSYNFSQQGYYTIEFIPNCCGNICPPCKFDIAIKHPALSCDCGKWKDKKITVNWKDRRGNQTTTIGCDKEIPNQLTDVCSNVPMTGSFSDYVCIPTNCQVKYYWIVLDQNNNVIASDNDTTSTGFAFNITSSGNYQLVVTPKCGDTRCEPCRISFSIKNVINCK